MLIFKGQLVDCVHMKIICILLPIGFIQKWKATNYNDVGNKKNLNKKQVLSWLYLHYYMYCTYWPLMLHENALELGRLNHALVKVSGWVTIMLLNRLRNLVACLLFDCITRSEKNKSQLDQTIWPCCWGWIVIWCSPIQPPLYGEILRCVIVRIRGNAMRLEKSKVDDNEIDGKRKIKWEGRQLLVRQNRVSPHNIPLFEVYAFVAHNLELSERWVLRMIYVYICGYKDLGRSVT